MDISNEEYHKTKAAMKSSSMNLFSRTQEQVDIFSSMKKRPLEKNIYFRFIILKDDEGNLKLHAPKDEKNTEMTVPKLRKARLVR